MQIGILEAVSKSNDGELVPMQTGNAGIGIRLRTKQQTMNAAGDSDIADPPPGAFRLRQIEDGQIITVAHGLLAAPSTYSTKCGICRQSKSAVVEASQARFPWKPTGLVRSR